MQQNGELDFDVTDDAEWTQERLDQWVDKSREMFGGAWVRVVQDPASKEWTIDLRAGNVRYDSTSNTLARVTGMGTVYDGRGDITDDAGNALPDGVVPGILGDCSGALTPWGTIITAEENVQFYYGDLEDAYSSQWYDFNNAGPFAAGGDIVIDTATTPGEDLSKHSNPNIGAKPRDIYGFLTEIDVGLPADEYYGATTAGDGHMKIGEMGRARWENATFVVGRPTGNAHRGPAHRDLRRQRPSLGPHLQVGLREQLHGRHEQG